MDLKKVTTIKLNGVNIASFEITADDDETATILQLVMKKLNNLSVKNNDELIKQNVHYLEDTILLIKDLVANNTDLNSKGHEKINELFKNANEKINTLKSL